MVLANSKKIRLCAKFEIDNFAAKQTTPLTTIMALITRQCMLNAYKPVLIWPLTTDHTMDNVYYWPKRHV